MLEARSLRVTSHTSECKKKTKKNYESRRVLAPHNIQFHLQTGAEAQKGVLATLLDGNQVSPHRNQLAWQLLGSALLQLVNERLPLSCSTRPARPGWTGKRMEKCAFCEQPIRDLNSRV
jgi:hypothetical protein